MQGSDQRVVATCGILSVAVGSANSMYKYQKLPSSRFLIGSGVAYLILVAMAEGEPELAKGLAMGILTTIVLGEGGGVLSYISHGEIDTQKKKHQPTLAGAKAQAVQANANWERAHGLPVILGAPQPPHAVVTMNGHPVVQQGGKFSSDSPTNAIPGL